MGLSQVSRQSSDIMVTFVAMVMWNRQSSFFFSFFSFFSVTLVVLGD